MESIKVFEETINSDVFKGAPIVLLFSKEDLFLKKLKEEKLKDYFESYDGDEDPENCYQFIVKLFLSENKFETDRISVFKANSIDTESMKEVSTKIFEKNILALAEKKDKKE
jgi:hypothetical protein